MQTDPTSKPSKVCLLLITQLPHKKVLLSVAHDNPSGCCQGRENEKEGTRKGEGERAREGEGGGETDRQTDGQREGPRGTERAGESETVGERWRERDRKRGVKSESEGGGRETDR